MLCLLFSFAFVSHISVECSMFIVISFMLKSVKLVKLKCYKLTFLFEHPHRIFPCVLLKYHGSINSKVALTSTV